MFDFYHWADWASQASASLRSKGMQATYSLTEQPESSANPAFFIDFDEGETLGRIIVWPTGDFDISIHRDNSPEAHLIPDLPKQATDQNFQALFERFVAVVAKR